MSFNEKINDILEEEIKLRLDLTITSFAETISKKYQIPLLQLLKDVPKVSATATCMGTKPDGTRCTFKVVRMDIVVNTKNRVKRLNRDSMSHLMVTPMDQDLEMWLGVQHVKNLFQGIGL